MARVGLQWVMEHEALEAFSVVLGVYIEHCPAPREKLNIRGRDAVTHVRAWCAVG